MALKYNKERRERWARLQAESDLMDTICIHVASGGTLIDLAETWDIPYGWPANWVHADPERSKRYMAALNDRAEWGTEVVLRELRRLGLSDIRQIFKDDGSVKDPKDWPEDLARAIASVEVDELFEGVGRERQQIGFTKKVKFWDKRGALELLGKNLRLFIDRQEIGIDKKLEDIIAASNEPKKD